MVSDFREKWGEGDVDTGVGVDIEERSQQEFKAGQANGLDFFGKVEEEHICCGKHR